MVILEEIDLAMFPGPARRETSEALLREIHRRLARELGAALRMVGRGDRSPAEFEAQP